MAFQFGAWTLPTFVPLLLLRADVVENSVEHGRMLLPDMVTERGILVFIKEAKYEAQKCVLIIVTDLCTSASDRAGLLY